MPRAILSFRLPQESAELENALHGADWRSVCQELHRWLRDLEKANKRPSPMKVLEMLHQTIADAGLDLYD
jgi:hypothetical protein